MGADPGFLAAARADVELLVLLHHRELDQETLAALAAGSLADLFETADRTPDLRAALRAMQEALAAIAQPPGAAEVDALAADYAAVYLIHSHRASPQESTWFDDEGLEQQTPMFQVRDWIQRLGLRLDDPQDLPADHLINQLRILHHLLERCAIGAAAAPLDTTARFLDEHLLRWVPALAARLSETGAPPFYGALAELTRALLDAVRDTLEQAGAHPRPDADEVERVVTAKKRLSRFDGGSAEPGCSPPVDPDTGGFSATV